MHQLIYCFITDECPDCYAAFARPKEMNEAYKWVMGTFWIIASITGIVGNTLVFYFFHKNREPGAFRHLNNVVMNLAVADFLYSICAAPLLLLRLFWGKT